MTAHAYTANLRRRFVVGILVAFGAAMASTAGAVTLPAADATVTIATATPLGPQTTVVGVVPANQRIHVVVSLKLRHRSELDAFLVQATNPATPAAQRRMPRNAFLANHAPTAQDAEAVAEFLRHAGFGDVEIAPNRLLVSAYAVPATVEAAFGTTLRQVRTASNEVAYANTAAVRIPTTLQSTIEGVLGLQTVRRPRTFARVADTHAAQPHSPLDFDDIYGAASLPPASDVTVGIITAGDMSPVLTDLNAFMSNNNLQVDVQVVTAGNGGTDTDGTGEWDLDSQSILGMAGNLKHLVLYTGDSMTFADLTQAMNAAVNDTTYHPQVVNMSFGACEAPGSATQAEANVLAAAVSAGITFSASTGDDGANCDGSGTFGVSDPSTQPNVVAVGGTRLNTTGKTYQSETVWSGGGGGVSTFEPKPAWQTTQSGNHRGVPDVAFAADPNTGAWVIVNGSTQAIGGTSLASPLFVGAWARLLQSNPSLGFAAPQLYTKLTAVDYHDVTSGNNATAQSNGQYVAASGWDNATGFGSFNVAQVSADIGQPGPPSISLAFAPNQIATQAISNLTITFSNASQPNDAATLLGDFTDTLPAGVQIAAVPNASTTCSGTLQAVANGQTITLQSGASIPAAGACTIKVDVTAPGNGTFNNAIAAGALHTSLGDNVLPATALLTVGNGMTTPVASVSPGTLAFNGSGSQTLTVANIGGGSLDYSFAEAQYNRQAGMAPHDVTSFQLDDGTAEAADALSDGTKQYAAIWLNRFPVVGPLAIDSVSIFWPTTQAAGGSLSGKHATLVVYYDADGDGNPANAVQLASKAITISTSGAYQTYTVSVAVPAAGDVYVGFSDSWANGGKLPFRKPVAEDTGNPQGRSLLLFHGDGSTPDLVTLGNNDQVEVLSQSNLMIRATGSSPYTSANCSAPSDITWLTETPATGTILGGHDAPVTVTANAAGLAGGNYSALLCATSNDTAHALIAVPVTLTVTGGGNQAPVADFAYTANNLDVSFTDQSTDSDGSIAAWAWDFGDGSTATQASPTHSYTAPGTYTVTLTVTDDVGAISAAKTQSVTVTAAANQAPVADFVYTANNLDVSFTDQSTDSDGSIAAWAWDFGDGGTSTQTSPTHSYAAAGTYTVTLTVTDNVGAISAAKTQSVTVTAATNQAPVADFAYTANNLDVSFTDQSADSDGSVAAWAWDFGDGGTSTQASPSHSYAASGTYTVTLTVTDNAGVTSAAKTQSVTVTAAANQAPVADFAYTANNLDVSFTDQSADSDGSVAAWAWDFGDGGTSTQASPTHSYAASGTYTVTLTVTDNAGVTSAAKTQNVTVTAVAGAPVATIDTTAVVATAEEGAATSQPLTIGNTGTADLSFNIAEAAAQQVVLGLHAKDAPTSAGKLTSGRARLAVMPLPAPVPAMARGGSVQTHGDQSFVLDDGSAESGLGWLDGSNAEWAAIYLNRFTPAAGTGAFTINTVSVLWPSQGGTTSLIGRQALIVAYYDADGDGDPGNATYLGQSAVTIASEDALETYAVSFDVPGAGDIYVGFEDAWAVAGFTPALYPGAVDTTSSAGRSFLYAMTDDTAPDVQHLANNTFGETLDAAGNPGNWMIRATGTTQGGPTASCSNPTSVPWLSVNPSSGTVAPAGTAALTIGFDATGLTVGTYNALLCVATNDPNRALIEVPVSFEVTACGSSVTDRIFGDGFDGTSIDGCTPPPANIVTGTINQAVPATFAGATFNFATGVYDMSGTLPSGFDVNLYQSGSGKLAVYWSSAQSSTGCLTTANDECKVLHSGDTVGTAGQAFSHMGGSVDEWTSGADGYFGIAFWNEATSELDYGYIHMTTTSGSGFPAQLLEFGFDNSGAPIVIP